jgi:hypothetical protein
MSDDQDKKPSDADSDLQRQIRADRKFSLTEAIGRLAGPGAMKGASPVTRKQQAEAEIDNWLRAHLTDPGGALQPVLLRHVAGSELLLDNYDQPLVVLAAYCHSLLESDCRLKDFVRDADIEWGRIFQERPHFDKEDAAPQPDDPYTAESVRTCLSKLIEQLTNP